MDSRLRGNDVPDVMDSRRRGKDIPGVVVSRRHRKDVSGVVVSRRHRKDVSGVVISRLRGNDVPGVVAVIPAKAGIHRRSTLARGGVPDTPIASDPSVIPAEAGMMVRTAPAGTPSSVIPAKAGFHATLTEHECLCQESSSG